MIENDQNARFRAKIIRTVRHYDPQRLPTLVSLINEHQNELDLLAIQIESQYGPEPPNPFRDRVVAMYTKYNPKGLENVDTLLDDYAGNEVALLNALQEKYGPEPMNEEMTTRAVAIRLTRAYEPQNLEAFFERLKQGITPEDLQRITQTLVAKYGAEPSNPYLPRVERIYARYKPSQLPHVRTILDDFAGNEDVLLQNLVAKYGPEPFTTTKDLVRNCAEAYDLEPPWNMGMSEEHFLALVRQEHKVVPLVPWEIIEKRRRIYRMYERFSKERLQTFDDIVYKYYGKEDVLLEALTGKYGPEESQDVEPSQVLTATTTDKSPEPCHDHDEEIRCMYEHYAPGKLILLPTIMKENVGNEKAFFLSLLEKYGPCPLSKPETLHPQCPEKVLELRKPFVTQNPTMTFPSGVVRHVAALADDVVALCNVPENCVTLARVCATQLTSPPEVLHTLGPFTDPTWVMALTNDSLIVVEQGSGLVHVIGWRRPEPKTFRKIGKLPRVYTDKDAICSYRARIIRTVRRYDAALFSGEGLNVLLREAGDNMDLLRNLWTELSHKYGITQEPYNPYHERLYRMYLKYNPDHIENIETILDDFAGNEEFLMEQLVTKYGPEPKRSFQKDEFTARAKIIRTVRHYDFPRLVRLMEHVDEVNVFSVAQTVEQEYGPEPPNVYHSRVFRMYARYNPDNLLNIDTILDDFAGNEEQLM
eukprot:PhF_6_TR40820/c0_g1_i2/m.61763